MQMTSSSSSMVRCVSTASLPKGARSFSATSERRYFWRVCRYRWAAALGQSHCPDRLSSCQDAGGEVFRSAPGNGTVSTQLIRLLVAKIRRMSERVFEVSVPAVRERLRRELLRLAADGTRSGRGVVIRPAPTHHDLAARIGSHREAVTRELNRLAEEHIVEIGRREIRIIDLALQATRRGAVNRRTGGQYRRPDWLTRPRQFENGALMSGSGSNAGVHSALLRAFPCELPARSGHRPQRLSRLERKSPFCTLAQPPLPSKSRRRGSSCPISLTDKLSPIVLAIQQHVLGPRVVAGRIVEDTGCRPVSPELRALPFRRQLAEQIAGLVPSTHDDQDFGQIEIGLVAAAARRRSRIRRT